MNDAEIDTRIRELLAEGMQPLDVAAEICDQEFAAGHLAAEEIELAIHEWTGRAKQLGAAA